MYSFIAISSDQLRTLQSNADQLKNVQVILLFIVSFAILVGLLNLLFYFVYKKSPDLKLNFFLPRFSRGQSVIKFNIEDGLGRPLGYTKCTVFQGEKIFKTFYPWSSHFKFTLPNGKFTITLEKFGYTSASTYQFELRDRHHFNFNLSMKATEDIANAKQLGIFAYIIFALTIILFVASLSVYLLNFLNLELGIQLVTLLLSASSLYLAYRYFKLTKFIKALSFKRHPLASHPIEIFGRHREPLKKVTTTKNGTLILMMSPGHYRFSPEKYSPRAIRVLELGLGNFKIKF